MYIVSMCLAGINCRYDGGNCCQNKICDLVANKNAIVVCPEQLAGFTTPREPAEITNGSGEDVLNGKARVMTKSGKDVTDMFIKGAEKTLKIANLLNIDTAILKDYSPSCGCGLTYDGSFKNKLIKGNGVTTSILLMNGIKVISFQGALT